MLLDTGPEQQMKPLTTEQEVHLSSDDRDDEITGQANANKKAEQENGAIEGQVDKSRDYSSLESDNIHDDNRTVDDSDIGSQLIDDSKNTSDGIDDTTKHLTVQEDLENESAHDDQLIVPSENPTPIEPENTVDSLNDNEFRDFDGNPAVDTAKSTPHPKENLFDVEPGNVLSNERQDEITSSNGSENSGISQTSSSLGLDNETETDSTIANPESNNTISDPKILTEDDQENILSASKKENLDLNEIPQVSYEGSKSSFEEQSIPENDLLRKSVNDNNKVNEDISESPNSGSHFSAPGIPAPSVVSAAVQVLPGKILVPAAVDQVQGQALAALQVLKVIISSHPYVSFNMTIMLCAFIVQF